MLTRRDVVRLAAAAPALTLSEAGIRAVRGSIPVASSPVFTFAPGTGADIFVKFYARKLQELANQTVIVENKVGMAGNIATEYVARWKT